MPMFELSDDEIKFIEDRRRVTLKQAGFREGVKAAIKLVESREPACNEERQLLLTVARDLKLMYIPEHLRLTTSSNLERICS